MKIGIWHPPGNGSPLINSLCRGFCDLGHSIHPFPDQVDRWDLSLMFIQQPYMEQAYLDFPKTTCPMALIDSCEYGWWTHNDSYAPRLCNAFTEDAMRLYEAPGVMRAGPSSRFEQQMRLKHFLEGQSFPYFLREMYRAWTYPPSYHPIDYALHIGSECRKEPDFHEYVNRPLDFYLAWGTSHPDRTHLAALFDGVPKTEIYVLSDQHPRLPHGEYCLKIESARVSMSYHGFGYGSFRVMETAVRCLLLQNRPVTWQHAEFEDGKHCLHYDVTGDTGQFQSDAFEKCRWGLENPEKAFELYCAGRAHCLAHHTETEKARYVLETIARHDYTKPTQLDLYVQTVQ